MKESVHSLFRALQKGGHSVVEGAMVEKYYNRMVSKLGKPMKSSRSSPRNQVGGIGGEGVANPADSEMPKGGREDISPHIPLMPFEMYQKLVRKVAKKVGCEIHLPEQVNMCYLFVCVQVQFFTDLESGDKRFLPGRQ